MADGIIFEGFPELNAAFDAATQAVLDANVVSVRKGAALVEASAKRHASGRPGPNVVSGSHRRSFNVTGPTVSGTTVAALVGPSMIYSRRLELGYVGADSLGRVYNQPPFPSLTPAVSDTQDELKELFTEGWRAALEPFSS